MSSNSKPSKSKRSTSDVILDAQGNINASKLEETMMQSLEYDVRYRQTDNAKKRAIKVSGSYDDFKARVACAHLKKLSSKDIDSLRLSKRENLSKQLNSDSGEGIITSSINSHVHSKETASILSKELQEHDKNAGKDAGLAKLTDAVFSKKPKSFLELNRDFKRLKDVENRKKYLEFVGQKRVVKLMSADSDAEFLEEAITALLTCASADGAFGLMLVNSPVVSSCSSGGGNISSNSNNESNNNSSSSSSSSPAPVASVFSVTDSSNPDHDPDLDLGGFSQIDNLDLLQWILAFTSVPKFQMLKCFFSTSTKDLITKLLDSITVVALDSAPVDGGDRQEDGDDDNNIDQTEDNNKNISSSSSSNDPTSDAANLSALCDELRSLYL